MKTHHTVYSIESVRQMVEEATASTTTLDDIHNLSRPGAPLAEANLGGGVYKKRLTDTAVRAILRRRLAQQLGRKSPRLLDDSHNLTCITCRGIAVKWEGRWLCENGHGGNTNA